MKMIYHNALAKQNITSIEQLQIKLQQIFESAEHQSSALVKIYRLFFPDWKKIKQIQGHPIVGQEMWKYICQLFVEFDREHHPDTMNGGLWIDNGFSSSDKLDEWGIDLGNCIVIYE